ncbi:hypothetical protein [Sphingomonas turrisvirgatae]|jgi:hypothetical protein|uniref:Uncharacterized protein n=1 Tax=Sphingomonas turrisvirgatae TaxID=1888892 RepID=A0A1E3LW49_9SPHN|nr:hypothetical protein [Sphingomonas turrisvirgatae]ODP38007.1 hypothetical protein BFL28_15980 [Sphingomonas turrisvirgatae]
MSRFRPSPGDIAAIREAARREANFDHVGEVVLETGRRQSLTNGDASINFALISDDPEWTDTDLDDHEPWSAFTRGVELSDEGRGRFDFYIRRRGDPHRDLHGNISIDVENGHIVRIYGYPDSYPLAGS